jgi:hypothetical protein
MVFFSSIALAQSLVLTDLCAILLTTCSSGNISAAACNRSRSTLSDKGPVLDDSWKTAPRVRLGARLGGFWMESGSWNPLARDSMATGSRKASMEREGVLLVN